MESSEKEPCASVYLNNSHFTLLTVNVSIFDYAYLSSPGSHLLLKSTLARQMTQLPLIEKIFLTT